MSTDQVLLGVGLIVVLAVGSQVLASQLRIPALIILLPSGFTAGVLTNDVNPERLLGTAFQPLVSLAVAVILYDSGLALEWGKVRGRARRVVPRLVFLGVPVKRLPITQTELRIVFRRPPRLGFTNWTRSPEPSQLIVKLDPATGIRFLVDAQRHDTVEPEQINLDMEFAQEGGEGPTPYEVLLHAALIGDSKRFTRQDGVEQCWRVMAPLLENPPPVHPYAKRTWRPEAADRIIEGYGRWHKPWAAS